MHGKISLEQCNARAPPDLLRQSPGLLAQSEPVDHNTARPDPGPKKYCATSRAEHSAFHFEDRVLKIISDWSEIYVATMLILVWSCGSKLVGIGF